MLEGVGATSGSSGKKGRRDNQIATSFESYLSENDVQVLGSYAGIGIKLDCVKIRCCRLRLTLPSEQCVKSILAAVAARSGGTCTEAQLFLRWPSSQELFSLKAKKVPKEGIHVERYPAAGPRELPECFVQGGLRRQ